MSPEQYILSQLLSLHNHPVRKVHYYLHVTEEETELAKVPHLLQDEARGQTLVQRSQCGLFPTGHGAFQGSRI